MFGDHGPSAHPCYAHGGGIATGTAQWFYIYHSI